MIVCPWIVGVCLLAAGGDEVSPLSVESEGDATRVQVTLRLPPDESAAILKADDSLFTAASQRLWLAVVDAEGKAEIPIFARYAVSEEHLVLTPRYPLLPGVQYRAFAKLPDGVLLSRDYQPAATATKTAPRVTSVFPSGEVLPANGLKFYVHFSEPMREGAAIFEQIDLVDEQGEAVLDPWRRVELWSPDATRLTLWIHPGRIKQGVNLREEFGPVLHPHRRYRLVIRGGVLSAQGVPLEQDFNQAYRTVAEDRERVSPQKWQLNPVAAGSLEPLRVIFDEPLDRSLLDRHLTVLCGDTPLIGDIEVPAGERAWQFTPLDPWPGQACTLKIDGELEDLAGNTPLRVFDTDLEQEPPETPQLSLPIVVRSPDRKN